MKSREYLLTLLDKLSILFPALSFGYAYDKISRQNVIQVIPASAYHKLDYGKAESNLIFDFVGKFPYESIRFVPQGSEEHLPEIEIEIKGIITKASYAVVAGILTERNSLSVVAALPYAYPEISFAKGNVWIGDLKKSNKPESLSPVKIESENTLALAA